MPPHFLKLLKSQGNAKLYISDPANRTEKLKILAQTAVVETTPTFQSTSLWAATRAMTSTCEAGVRCEVKRSAISLILWWEEWDHDDATRNKSSKRSNKSRDKLNKNKSKSVVIHQIGKKQVLTNR